MTIDAGHTPDREILGWNVFGDASRELTTRVPESGFVRELGVAIARGGLLRAGSVTYALDPRLDEPILFSPMLDAPSVSDQRVLPVDDVSDSGRTLAMVRALFLKAGAEVRTFCLYSKPKTVLAPDVVWRKTPKRIAFAWSSLPPVTA